MYKVWTYERYEGWDFEDFESKKEALEYILNESKFSDFDINKIILTKDVKLDILEEKEGFER